MKRVNVESKKFCLKNDWASKIAQSVPMLPFSKVGTGFSRKKTQTIQNREKLPICFAVECDGMSKIYENVQKVAFVEKN